MLSSSFTDLRPFLNSSHHLYIIHTRTNSSSFHYSINLKRWFCLPNKMAPRISHFAEDWIGIINETCCRVDSSQRLPTGLASKVGSLTTRRS